MSYCVTDYNFLSTPEFYKLLLHYFGFIAIPLHIFGAYCILIKTPSIMQSVKWNLFNFHFWNCFCDIGFSLLTTPFVIVPAFAWYPLGIFNYFGISTAWQTIILVYIVCVVFVSIIGIFENRYLVLIACDHTWRKFRTTYFIFNLLIACLTFVPFIFTLPDQNEARQFFLDRWKCAPDYAPLDTVFFLATATRFVARTGGVVVAFFFIQIIVFYKLTGKVLKQQMGRNISKNTAELLKKFRETLMIQLSIPVFIMLFPIAYLGASNWLWFHFQFLNNISFIIISSHGFFSTIVMLIVHRPYREFAIGLTRFGTIYSRNEENSHMFRDMRSSVIT
ncbi:hypothetical protein CAEBREN_31653 [Caenorhabditis brenneri]|uniref:Serpentine Receptor, class H n=1 Tax=Caenorhabditis brenneri TaxID=135651 RepID=G0NHX7_CAEBE|nr:hypothetical protein CAEBREN_31653 [Caenorhabditis brenneri]